MVNSPKTTYHTFEESSIEQDNTTQQNLNEVQSELKKSINQVIILEIILNALVVSETFFSVQSTEYFYPWNAHFVYNQLTCDVGDVTTPDCVEQFCNMANNENILITLIGSTCKNKNYLGEEVFMIANYGITIGFALVLVILSIISLKIRATKSHENKKTAILFQIVFVVSLIVTYVIVKSIELSHIKITGLKYSEMVEFICLTLALVGECTMSIFEYRHLPKDVDQIETTLESIDAEIIHCLNNYIPKANLEISKYTLGFGANLHNIPNSHKIFYYHFVRNKIDRGLSESEANFIKTEIEKVANKRVRHISIPKTVAQISSDVLSPLNNSTSALMFDQLVNGDEKSNKNIIPVITQDTMDD